MANDPALLLVARLKTSQRGLTPANGTGSSPRDRLTPRLNNIAFPLRHINAGMQCTPPGRRHHVFVKVLLT